MCFCNIHFSIHFWFELGHGFWLVGFAVFVVEWFVPKVCCDPFAKRFNFVDWKTNPCLIAVSRCYIFWWCLVISWGHRMVNRLLCASVSMNQQIVAYCCRCCLEPDPFSLEPPLSGSGFLRTKWRFCMMGACVGLRCDSWQGFLWEELSRIWSLLIAVCTS